MSDRIVTPKPRALSARNASVKTYTSVIQMSSMRGFGYAIASIAKFCT